MANWVLILSGIVGAMASGALGVIARRRSAELNELPTVFDRLLSTNMVIQQLERKPWLGKRSPRPAATDAAGDSRDDSVKAANS